MTAETELARIAPVLQDLAQMTSLRSHQRLERSVLNTLARLPDVASVCMMDLARLGDADYVLYLRPDEASGTDPAMARDAGEGQPLAALPMLRAAVQAGYTQLAEVDAAGHVLWLILWHRQQARQCVQVRQARPFTSDRLTLLTAVFQVYQNYHDLLDDSERDALTGLFNRKTFDELRFKPVRDVQQVPQAHAAWRWRQADASYAQAQAVAGDQMDAAADAPSDWLAIIDIDDFKQINDRFGHLYGDEVLLLVANLLKQGFRSSDRVFRYGGEEFVAVLSATELPAAWEVLEQLRKSVADYRFPQVGQVTVSIGFVRAGDAMLANLIEQADRALYYVKKHGKNQVAYYGTLLEEGKVHAPMQNQDVDLF